MDISSMMSSIQQIMYNDAGVDVKTQSLPQTIWIIFLKIFDCMETEWEFQDPTYQKVIPQGFRWDDWVVSTSAANQLTGDELIDFVNNKLIPALSGKKIKDENGKEYVPFTSKTRAARLVKEFMGETINYMKNGYYLRQVVNKIDEIDFSDFSDRHAFNDIYEGMLKGLQKNNGEVFTPRAITSFCVDKVNPIIGEQVADFACGTGGFLVDALHHMKAQNPNVQQMATLQTSFYGVEKKALPYRLCVTNMLLNDIEDPQIVHGNTLEEDVRNYTDKYDVILMNPPYGGHEDALVQNNFPANLRSSETADLFLVEIMYRLKKKGRCAVVLPDGIMFGSSNAQIEIKKKLLNEFNLHTIIRLPSSIFAPYTSINTNILFFDNTGSTKTTWFYRFDLPNGQKFSMTKNPLVRESLKEVDEWWDNRREIKDISDTDIVTWKAKEVTKEEIEEANYSFDFCGYPKKDKVILSPEDTIQQYLDERESLSNSIKSKIEDLLEMLGGV